MTTIQELIEKQTTINENVEKVYQAGVEKGKSQGGDISKFGIINEVSGSRIVTCDYVNENPHNVEVQLSSETITDFSGVTVKKCGKNLWNAEYASDVNNWTKVDNSAYPSIPVFVGKGSTVTVSYSLPSEIIADMYFVISKDGTHSDIYMWMYHCNSTGLISDSATFVAENDYIYMAHSGSINNILEHISPTLQIEHGAVATEYEPYTEETYSANADGTVDGVTSISPVTTLLCETEGVNIEAKYYQIPSVEYDRFWDGIMYNHRATEWNMQYVFSGLGWNKNTFKPKYDICPKISASHMFAYNYSVQNVSIFETVSMSDIEKECNIVMDFSKCANLTGTFRDCMFHELNVIDLSSVYSTGSFGFIFYHSMHQNVQFEHGIGIKRINRLIFSESINSGTVTSPFASAYNLEYVGFEGTIGFNGLALQWSNNLEKESLLKLIDCLADKTSDTSGTTWKVTIGTKNLAKLSDEELAIAYQKGWLIE